MGVVYVNGVSALMGCCIADASAGPGRHVICRRGLNWRAAPRTSGSPTQPSPATTCPGDRGHQQGCFVVPELPSSPSQHHAAGNGVHSDGSAPCPGAYGSSRRSQPRCSPWVQEDGVEVLVSGMQAALPLPWQPHSLACSSHHHQPCSPITGVDILPAHISLRPRCLPPSPWSPTCRVGAGSVLGKPGEGGCAC